MYTSKDVEQYKDKLVLLVYRKKNYIHELTGTITANTNSRVIFDVNNEGEEINLKHNQIMDIRER